MDIFREVEKLVDECNLEWKKLICITTDGGRNLCETKKGLVLHKLPTQLGILLT